VIGALLAAGALAAWLGPRRWPLQARLRGAPEKDEVDEADEEGPMEDRWRRKAQDFCGKVEEGMEYHTKKQLYWVGNIYSQEMCCAECDADPECGAWTYGKKQGMEGLTNHCYLKKLHEGEEPMKVEREGVVSGLLSHKLKKHGVVAALLASDRAAAGVLEPTTIRRNETCPGTINITGEGTMSVVAATWKIPGERAGPVEVPEGQWAVVPHLNSRSYLASRCKPGEYDNEDYASFRLLGATIRYTTDLSQVGCGCNAQLHLLPMHGQERKSDCEDYVCNHGWSRCGELCSEIGLQDANRYAWSSNVHVHDDHGGVSQGYGGGSSWIGRRDWNASQYGPNGSCIDTTWPFDVKIHFPVKPSKLLKAMEVTLSQDGKPCNLETRIDRYAYEGRDALAELSVMLAEGVTPVMSYWSSSNLDWMDGAGKDGGGPCVKDAPEACPDSVTFYNFAVERGDDDAGAGRASGSLMDTAIAAVHDRVVEKAEQERQAQLQRVTKAGSANSSQADCADDCDAVTDHDRLNNSTDMGTDDDYVEVEGGNTEWLVLRETLSIIEDRRNLSSAVLGARLAGEVIIGKRDSDWIVLAHGRGFALARNGTTPWVKERVVSYEKIVKGTCQGAGLFPIEDLSACAAAAFALGYFDARTKIYSGGLRRPEGCYLHGGRVWLATNEANVGNGVINGIEPICSSESYPTTTTTITTTSTTSTTTSTTKTSTSSTTWGWPTLFCIEVVRTHGYEFPLVKEQQKRHASIFHCDEYAVFSDGGVSRTVGIDPTGAPIKTIVIPPIKQAIGNLNAGATTNSWLNTQTFLQVWDLCKKDGRYQRHDWTIKVDPDAVFFPDRLRAHLKGHTWKGGKFFVMNCNKFNPVALYGSIEIFSKAAVETYLAGQWHCRNTLNWHSWGEDFFMSHCMDMLGVGRLYDFQLLSDKRCFYSPCSDTSKVVYHDYKDANPHGSWFRCWLESIRR